MSIFLQQELLWIVSKTDLEDLVLLRFLRLRRLLVLSRPWMDRYYSILVWAWSVLATLSHFNFPPIHVSDSRQNMGVYVETFIKVQVRHFRSYSCLKWLCNLSNNFIEQLLWRECSLVLTTLFVLRIKAYISSQKI